MFKELLTQLWGWVGVVIGFGGSIAVHECGHFLAAKWRGLRVTKFSIGFGPKLFGWSKNGTEYCVSLLPLGGYVVLPQMCPVALVEEACKEKLPEVSYADKLIVCVAGAAFNVLLALLLACVLWWTGMPAPESTTTIGYVHQTLRSGKTEVPGPAHLAGLQAGDVILSIDGQKVGDFREITQKVIMGRDYLNAKVPRVTVEFLRAGVRQTRVVYPAKIAYNTEVDDKVRMVGISPRERLIVDRIELHSPAALVDLMPGDEIMAVNGVCVYGYLSLQDRVRAIFESRGTCTLTLKRSGQTLEKFLQPQKVALTYAAVELQVDGRRWLLFGDASNLMLASPNLDHAIQVQNVDGREATFDALRVLLEDGFGHTLKMDHGALQFDGAAVVRWIEPKERVSIGVQLSTPMVLTHTPPLRQIANVWRATIDTIKSLFDRHSDVHVSQLMGPPGIMRALYLCSVEGVAVLLWFMLLLNVNLAVLNLLPIPVLDGGQIMFSTVERILGRKLNPEFIFRVQALFIVLFLALTIYVSVYDVRRWYGGRSIERDEAVEHFLRKEIKFERSKS